MAIGKKYFKKVNVFHLFLFINLAVFAQNETMNFTPALFDAWIDCRLGNGKKPALWYCFGEIYSYPEGKLVGKMEGVDLAHMIRPAKDSVIQLNRKIFVYEDTSGKILYGNINGFEVQHIEYPYQLITYKLKDGRVETYVTQGSGASKTTLGPGYNTRVRKAGKSLIFSSPVFINLSTPRGKYEAYENYDFFVVPSAKDLKSKYMLTWNRFGDLPGFLGGGKGIIQLICYRVADFESLSETLKKHITQYAHLWKNPPQSLEEIKELQNTKK
ncbi:MAG: hypothetical protein N2747_06905 [Chitinophagaceae bacterium]|nr:hypothetical protein [Chitinophagaceae bacterium]